MSDSLRDKIDKIERQLSCGNNSSEGGTGKTPAHTWNGTILSFENPDGSFDAGVNLIGPTGAKGADGAKGATGTAGTNGTNGSNGTNGWTPQFVFEANGTRLIQKLSSYIGGTGTAPTTNIGSYVTSSGTFTTDKALAADFKGAQSDNLIYEYTHSGNKEVVIQSYDSTTGYFTATNHGLTNGKNGNFLLNWGIVEDQSKIMFQISTDWGYTITVIDANTFYLGSILPVPTNLDLTKFHFEEYTNSNVVNLTNLDLKEFRLSIVTKGFRYQVPFEGSVLSVNDVGIVASTDFVKNINEVNSQQGKFVPIYSNILMNAKYKLYKNVLYIDSNIKSYTNTSTQQLLSSVDRVVMKSVSFDTITKLNGLGFMPNGANIRIYKI